jgi:enterochelin esterase-like enzyme
MYSSEVGDWFQIYVHLPEGYSAEDGPETHLAILLDADWYMDGSHIRLGYGGVVEIVEQLAAAGSIPPVAILGIGEINKVGQNMRGRDFLSAPDRFIRFISNKLLPQFFAETTLNGEGFQDLTIIGHSDGGYYSVWALFRDGRPRFRNAVAISGDFTKPYYDVFKLEEAYSQRTPSETACLFLGVGGLEEGRFLWSFAQLTETIESREGSNLVFRSRSYGYHDHGSVVAPGFSGGLSFSFSSECYPQPPPSTSGRWSEEGPIEAK